MSSGWVASESWNACATPAKRPWMLAGRPIRRAAFCTAATASPSATPGARLKEMVTAGKRPWWLTWSGAELGSKRVSAVRGTVAPVLDER